MVPTRFFIGLAILRSIKDCCYTQQKNGRAINNHILSVILIPACTHQIYNTSTHSLSHGYCRSLLWRCGVEYGEGEWCRHESMPLRRAHPVRPLPLTSSSCISSILGSSVFLGRVHPLRCSRAASHTRPFLRMLPSSDHPSLKKQKPNHRSERDSQNETIDLGAGVESTSETQPAVP